MTSTFPYLDAVLKELHDNTALHTLVDGNLFKFKSLEESEPYLTQSLHQTVISVEIQSWPGDSLVAEPTPVIDIRCRKGPEECLAAAKAVKDILDDGISEVIDGVTYSISVSSLAGDMAWDKTLQAWRLIYQVKGIIYTPATITSLTPSLASPQKPETKVYWFCACPQSATQNIRYRFSLNGPGTGNQWQDMTGWTVQAYWVWTLTTADIGSNQVKVEVRNARGLPAADDSETANYTVTANALPVLTSLTPSLSSPQAVGTKVSFIAVASDTEGDWILYRFWLKGPGTGNQWQDQTGWITKNEWTWTPEPGDTGSNQVKVDIIDQQHAGRSGYDATATIDYTIGASDLPSITSLTPNFASPQDAEKAITFTCTASDPDGVGLYYRFILTGPGTGSVARYMTSWSRNNSWTWTPTRYDIGSNTIEVQIRDGRHAGAGSYDDNETLNYTITDPMPTISDIVPSLASPQDAETTITFTAVASRTTQIVYRFWLSGPNTGDEWQDMTGWQSMNSWTWRTNNCDVGTNTIRCQVCDVVAWWSDSDTTGHQEDITYTISSS